MSVRVLALVLVLAVLPSLELGEQVAHVVEHAWLGEDGDHTAHHEDMPGDCDHCTGLVHVCACHQASVMVPGLASARTALGASALRQAPSPAPLVDRAALEPPHRPPIA